MSNILELMVCILMSLNINSVNSITVDRVEDGITTLEVVTPNPHFYIKNRTAVLSNTCTIKNSGDKTRFSVVFLIVKWWTKEQTRSFLI